MCSLTARRHVSKRAVHRTSIPWVCSADLRRLASFGVGGAAAALTPQRFDAVIADVLSRLYTFVSPHTADRIAEAMSATLPAPHTVEPRRAAAACLRMRLEDGWGRLRGLRRLAWHPAIDLEGIERVQEARAAGRGVVLWGMRFASATAIKQAFYRSELPLVHLSRVDHGAASTTALGLRLLSRLFCRAENPYLADRVQIPLDGSPGYLMRLRHHLRDGACVSIFGEHEGVQNVEASVLGARRAFAPGAPSIAWLENAALFTVYALRVGPYHYRVVVDREIPVEREIPRKRFAEQAVAEFARRLERLIIDHPADWQGWLYHHFEPGPRSDPPTPR